MPASNRKQLNVRDTEAYDLAHAAARREGRTTADVVVRALRAYVMNQPDLGEELPPEIVEENRRKLAQAVKALWGGKEPPRGADFSTEFLYDENGL